MSIPEECRRKEIHENSQEKKQFVSQTSWFSHYEHTKISSRRIFSTKFYHDCASFGFSTTTTAAVYHENELNKKFEFHSHHGQKKRFSQDFRMRRGDGEKWQKKIQKMVKKKSYKSNRIRVDGEMREDEHEEKNRNYDRQELLIFLPRRKKIYRVGHLVFYSLERLLVSA